MSYLEGGLGFVPVAAAAPVAAATGPLAPLTFAALMLSSALPFFPTVGAGRAEADAIGPTDQEFNASLARAGELLTQPLTLEQLRQLYNYVDRLWQQYQAFLYQGDFTADGDTRASDQAVRGNEPRVSELLSKIRSLILANSNPAAAIPRTVQSGVPRLAFPGNAISETVTPAGLFQNPPGGQIVFFDSEGGPSLLGLAALAALALVISKG